MPWKWYDSKVIKIEDQTPTTKRIFVEIPKEEPLGFHCRSIRNNGSTDQ